MARLSPRTGPGRAVRPASRRAKPVSTERLAAFEERLNYQFSDRALLIEALTHGSVDTSERNGRAARVNERLEFLGDRVLGVLAAEALFQTYPEDPEGDLAPRFNALVRKETCADVAREVGLDQVIILAGAEKQSGGAAKPAILGDACEAVMAAIYLDGGLEPARAFFVRFWQDRIETLEEVPQDPKSALQEWVQGRTKETPRYTVLDRSGPDHAPVFVVEVSVPGLPVLQGSGPSKRAAEQAAATALLVREGIRPDLENAGDGDPQASSERGKS